LEGLNISVQEVVQSTAKVPLPPAIFLQNAYIVQRDAIVAAFDFECQCMDFSLDARKEVIKILRKFLKHHFLSIILFMVTV
jgi:hypothetical protein